jgi:asparagine synthase (glutamine-hydrolysing)
MCGIAGILYHSGIPSDGTAVREMTRAMKHRGPDAEGFFSAGPLDLGHLRLSIIDLSAAANQPFHDSSGRYTMVYNGEIYNFKEVRARLDGYPFRTSSDTEVLIAAYAQWGADCLRHMRGMFAFAIWDHLEKTLFLARDRMGVKPLYYYDGDGQFLFASEVRGILATGLVEKRLSREALVEFFHYQSVSYPYSPIEGILQLEAGAWMKVGKDRREKGVYWDVTGQRPDFDYGDRQAVHKRIGELMLQSVGRRLVSDVPVGAFLSGGIDSSAVVGLMAAAGASKPNTFTVAFEEKEYDESPYAAIVAKKFATNHTRILLKPTVFLDELTSGLDAMDIPSGDGINTYVVSKAIRQSGMTVALSGAGGDELFAGYPFFPLFLRLQARKELWRLPAGLRGMAGLALTRGRPEGRRGRMAQLLRLPSPAIEHVYPIFRQIISPDVLDELSTLRQQGRGVTAVEEKLQAMKCGLHRLPLLSQVSAAEYLGYTQHTLLKDTDQMSMAVSLEVREPYFDSDLVEFVLGIPDAIKKPEYPKSLLVESLKPLLPEEVVFRKKQGFLFPWSLWLRNDLSSFCDDLIKKMAQRPFVNGKQLLAHWQRFLKGDAHVRWSEIWLFVVLEYWLEKYDVC